MSYVDADGKRCTCSRNRKCRDHATEDRAARRIEPATHKAERVEVGIEALRAKYAPERRR